MVHLANARLAVFLALVTVALARPQCYDSFQGAVNRSATRLRMYPLGWLSGVLVHDILDIILREFLGFTVDFVEPDSTIGDPTVLLGRDAADIMVEAWGLEDWSPAHLRYVVEEKTVESLGLLGFQGRDGLFVNRKLSEAAPWSTYYTFWREDHLFPQLNITRFGDLNLSALLGNLFPLCFEEWCGKGKFEGYWAPAKCQTEPWRCALLFKPASAWALGRFEQLVVNLNLSIILAHVGEYNQGPLLKQLADQHKNTPFFWFEPDPLLTQLSAQRVSFPDYEPGCDQVNEAPSGKLKCDWSAGAAYKGIRRALRQQAPEAVYAIQRMKVTQEEITDLISSAKEGGGSLDPFEAACAFVKQREATLVQEMVPPCIRSPPANPVTGDLVFDPSLLACRPVTKFPEVPSSSACLQAEAGAPDRNETRVRLVRRSHMSHALASTVLEILLRDVMRYDVWLVNASASPASEWGAHIAADAFDIDVENREALPDSPAYLEYVAQQGAVLDVGNIGYEARPSIFILPHTVAKTSFASFWRFYNQGHECLGSTDFYKFSDTELRLRLRLLVGEDFPLCGPPTYPWCGADAGGTEGFYVPPLCQERPSECLVVFAASPELDTGYFEQLTKSLGLPLVFAYLGGTKLEEFVHNASQAEGKDLLFYGREPDTFLAAVNATRVAFPDFSEGCDRHYMPDPRDGTVKCDSRPIPLKTLMSKRLALAAPEVEFVAKRLTFTSDELRMMMWAQASSGGVYSAACSWVRDNLAALKKSVVPACLVAPLPLEEVRVGDEIFKPVDGACREVQCLANQVTTVMLDSVVCRTCEEGLLPDPNQTKCQSCPPGSSPEAQASGLLECTCDAGGTRLGSSSGLCQPCAAGTFADAPRGALNCMNCSAGTYSSSGSTACLQCPPGTSSSTSGASTCPRCSMDGFQEVAGATACDSCGAGMATPYPGAESEALCRCRAGSFRMDPSSPCRACPGGMTCAAGSDLSSFFEWHATGRDTRSPPPFPRLRASYMSVASDPLSVYSCTGSSRCPGGAPGTCGVELRVDVVSCGQCSEGFYWAGEVCRPCPESSWLLPLVPSLAMPLLVVIMYRVTRDEVELWGRWTHCMASLALLLLNSFQAFSSVLSANLAYADYLGSWTTGLAFTVDPTSLFMSQCVGIRTFQSHLVGRSLIPVALLVVVVLTHLASHLLATLSGRQGVAMNKDRTANLYFSLIFAFFTALSSVALTTFMCAENPNGRATLLADRSVHCYDEDWRVLASIAGVALAYVVGFGALFCWAAIVAPYKFRERSFQRRWKFLFVKFSPAVWWWALCFCGKGLLTILGFTFIQSGFLQIFWVMWVTICYGFALFLYLPWRHRTTVVMDLFSCLVLVLLCALVAFAHANAEATRNLGSFLHTTIGVLMIGPTSAGACLLLVEVYAQQHRRVKAAFEAELRLHYRTWLERGLLGEEEAVQVVGWLDDWARWHILSALRVLSCKQARRLSDGRLENILNQQGALNAMEVGQAALVVPALSSARVRQVHTQEEDLGIMNDEERPVRKDSL